MATINKVGTLPYPTKVIAQDGSEIEIGYLKLIPLKNLEWATMNRTEEVKHIIKMECKIREYGMLDAIKVFDLEVSNKSTNKLKYQPAEGNHRVHALVNIFGKNSDVMIPWMVLPERYNIDDVDQTLETIVMMNKDNKPWTLYDYIKGWAKTGRKEYVNLLNLINQNIANKNNVSVAQATNIFCGGRSTEEYKQLKGGKLFVKQSYREFIKLFNDTLADWNDRFGVSKTELHKTFSTHLFNQISTITRSELSKKVDDTELRLWVEDLLVHMGDEIHEFFESQKRMKRVNPKFKVQNLPAFHEDMRDWFVQNFKNFHKDNPEPKSKKVTLNKFMKAPTRKVKAVA